MTSVPQLLVLTDRRVASRNGHDLLGAVAAAVGAGAPAVVAREKDLPQEDRRQLLRALQEVVVGAGGRFLVASDVDLARELDADGVHLAAADPAPERDEVEGLLGRSCHGRDEVAAAIAGGADYCTLSPVAASATKPGYGPALGADGLRAGVSAADGRPVLALGGVAPEDVIRWCAAGAHGVAVLGGILGAVDPAHATHRYLDALATVRASQHPPEAHP